MEFSIKKNLVLIVFMCLFCAQSVFAADVDDPVKRNAAKVIFDRAVALIEAKGAIEAFCIFNTDSSNYVQEDIHVIAVNFDGVVFANSIDVGYVGVNISQSVDAESKHQYQDALDVMNKHDDSVGEISWKWYNPLTSKVELQRSFFKRFAPDEFRVEFFVTAVYFVPLEQ